MAASDAAWKNFDTSSEAGRLLRQIYGSKGPPVNVPLPRQSKTSRVPKDGWRPVSNRVDQVDPRKATRSLKNERSVKAPRPIRQGSSYAAIDFVEKRKTGSVIHSEIEDMKMRVESYRPPHQRPVDEAEKCRFSEVCAYRGGKGLPAEMTAVTMEVLPSEQLAKLKEQERLDQVRRRRAGLPEHDAPAPGPKCGPLGGTRGALAETIVAEIEERRQHLSDMDAMGTRSKNEREIAIEIQNRVTELRRLDPRAAQAYGLPEEDSYNGTRNSAPFHRE